MSKKSAKSPARKSTKPAPKQDAAIKDGAPKDAVAPKATVPTPRDARLPAPGTSITREYKGKGLKVKYLDDGVEVDGKTFSSLSAAARAVTGAKSINGFLWFGLIPAKATPPTAPKAKAAKPAAASLVAGNDIGTPAGQRAALEAAGLGKKGARKPVTAKGESK